MVLEHIVPESWLEKRSYYAFLLGAFYSIIGITLARILFASDPALAAVAFTSLLLLPEIYKLFSIEEKQQERDKKGNLRAVWRNNGDFFRVLLFIFLGIMVVYSIAAIMLPSLAVNTLFREQLAMRSTNFAATGGAGFSEPLFWSLLKNNAIVIGAVFFVALLAGDGAIFLITWNASVWGTIFGATARNAAYFTQGEPFIYFFQILLTVTPHVLLEGSAYILAAMAGGLISRSIVRGHYGTKGWSGVARDNALIIGLALAFLVVGVLVETWVLANVSSYESIIRFSLLAH